MMHHGVDVPTTSPLMDRRNFLVAATASLLCAPAIVRASSLMPIKVVDRTPVSVPANEICEGGESHAGWAERVGYQMMDHVLKTGWTSERAARYTAVFLKAKCGKWLPTRGMAS